ncbi:MAG TPA: hypothetical protein PKU96_03865 [bacterium]|nr:hypothetical protein [Myxococcales bacterium]OQA61653.1 MAG: hypothetical protein BWY40_00489 [bacterium ADurb.Bin270]HPW45489.1 hypothetical protein [bacterium]HQC51001.1 hypothetical protein [bacterium]HQG13330.1 hypothetical protein [bacterium]
MKRITIVLALILLGISSFSCNEDLSAPDMVCCESYGFGAMMVKCCEEYTWIPRNECAIPEGFVGGGKEIVGDSLCGK